MEREKVSSVGLVFLCDFDADANPLQSYFYKFSELNACGSATTVGVDDEIALTAACLLSAKGIDIISVSKDVFGLKVEVCFNTDCLF